MKSAFVTGGTGFLGLNVVEQLTRAGWQVTALHRATSNLERLKAFDVALVQGSITSADEVLAAMPEHCDAVFHVAGNTSVWSGRADEQTRVNVDGTRNLVNAALAKHAKCFVQTSSISAYGPQAPPSFDESAKSTALTSPSNYERTKFLGEEEVRRGVARGLHAVILNPGNIIGRFDAHQWGRMILMLHRKGLPGVLPSRSAYCAAEEVARAHLTAVEKGRNGQNYILAGTDATMLEFVHVLGEQLGRKVPSRATPIALLTVAAWASQLASLVSGKEPQLTPDVLHLMTRPFSSPVSDLAVRELGYRVVPLEAMVKTAIDWLRSERLLS